MPNLLRPLRAARFSAKRKRWRHTSHGDSGIAEPLPSTFRLLTWNVDFMEEDQYERLETALMHVQEKLMKCDRGERPMPCCFLLQEVHADAFCCILENEWIQEHFLITPVSPDKWPTSAVYGCVTLVSRTIPVVNARSLVFENSTMGRNALMVDLKLSVPGEHARVVTLRVANAHLESMPEGGQARPVQMALIAKLLMEEELHGGILGGDMNAIGPSDEMTPADVGLVDTWKGKGKHSGFTWGYQPGSEFPPNRLDKILFTPGEGYKVEQPKVVGKDVKTPAGKWVSDHYGLLTTVRLVED
jgi:tyrosyl-DNA phosphodiesterase 2